MRDVRRSRTRCRSIGFLAFGSRVRMQRVAKQLLQIALLTRSRFGVQALVSIFFFDEAIDELALGVSFAEPRVYRGLDVEVSVLAGIHVRDVESASAFVVADPADA